MIRISQPLLATLLGLSFAACSSHKPKPEDKKPPIPVEEAMVPAKVLPQGGEAPGKDAPAPEKSLTLQLEGVDYKDAAFVTKPIEILAWSWGITNNADGRIKRPFESKAQEISLTKFVGSDSPHLLKLAVDKKVIKKLVLKTVLAAETTLVMTDAKVTAVSLGGSGGEERLTENLTFSFASVENQFVQDGKTSSSGRVPAVVKGAKR